MKRIGLFGGSFNPPHLGHLHLAESVHDALSLDEVRLIPSRISPHRSMAEYAPEADRLEMCRLAAEGYPWLTAEDYELQQDRVSYTYSTVRHFADLYPDAELFWLIGGDMLKSFTTWHRWEEILQLCAVAAVAREPDEYAELQQVAAELRQYGEIHLINVDSYPVSSTKIREMIRSSQNYPCYLPEKVVQYIKENQLYRQAPKH